MINYQRACSLCSVQRDIQVSSQLYRFGVRQLRQRWSQVFVHLAYTPKTETLKAKFGNLPINYVRLATETEEELESFALATKRFDFNLTVGEEVPILVLPPSTSTKRLLDASTTTEDDDDDGNNNNKDEDDDEEQKKKRKIRILENRLLLPPAVVASTSPYIEIYDDDVGEFCSQKYSIVENKDFK